MLCRLGESAGREEAAANGERGCQAKQACLAEKTAT